MDDFTRNPWTITKVVPPSREVVGHKITISGTEGHNQAKVTCDGCGSYPDGTYRAEAQETISDGKTYRITLYPGPTNVIVCTYLSEGTGSWTAEDSPSPAGVE